MEDMNKVLGLGEKFSKFPDNKVRTIYPITMLNFQVFMKNFAMVNTNKLWMNFMYEEAMQAVHDVVSLSFKDEEDIDTLLGQITTENFEDIMTVIKVINGFEEVASETPNEEEV